jgi:hypothetical protein
MGSSINNKATEMLDKQKKQKVWMIAIICLAATVVLGTVAMLRYIGRAMTGDLTCTVEEHVHSVDAGCYTSEAAEDGSTALVLICEKQEHTHSEECYAGDSETQESTLEIASEESNTPTADIYDETAAAIQARFNELPDVEAYLAYSEDERAAVDAVITELFAEYNGSLSDEQREKINIIRAMDIVECRASLQTADTQEVSEKAKSVALSSVSDDLAEYITDVYGSGTVYDKTTGLLKETGLTIEITVPSDIVRANNYFMIYNYPAGIVVPDELIGKDIGFLMGGTVGGECIFGDNGDGTYSIKVSFDKNVVDGIVGDISGYVTFSGYMDQNAADREGNIKVQFNDQCILSVERGSISYPENETLFYDIKTKKEGSFSPSEDTITYTVKIASNKGTPNPINITDVLSTKGLNVSGLKSVTVSKGNYVTYAYDSQNSWKEDEFYETKTASELSKDSYTLEKSDGKVTFNAVLDGLDEGTYYELKYTYELSDIPNGTTFKPENTVTASSRDDEKAELIKHSSSISLDVEKDYKVSKNGSYDESVGKIKWTITVNSNNMNIAGGNITDEMFENLTDADFQVNPAKGYSFIRKDGKITGMQFDAVDGNSNSNTYDITYYTDAEKEFESRDITNNVYFDGNGDGVTDKEDGCKVTVPGAGVEKLEKNIQNAEISADAGTAEVTWNVTVKTSSTGIKAGTVFEDVTFTDESWRNCKTGEEHYMTVSQVNEWAGKLVWDTGASLDANGDYIALTLTSVDGKTCSYNDVKNNRVSKDTKFTGWKIEVKKDIAAPKDCSSLNITYKTTADLSNVEGGENNYYNKVSSGRLSADKTYTYYKKYVVKKGQGDDGHTAKEASVSNNTGELTWTVDIMIDSAGSYSDLTVTDTLPKGVVLTGMSVEAQNSYWGAFGLSLDDEGAIAGDNYALKAAGNYDAESGEVAIVISPQDGKPFAAKTLITVTYNCKTDDDILSDRNTCKFTNKVKVTSNDGEYGSDDSTIEWSYTDSKIKKNILDKSGNYDDITSRLNYTVIINPEGKDLMEGKDTLELTDILAYNDADDTAELRKYTLIPGTVKLYKAVVNADGEYSEGEQISEWSWVSETNEVGDISGSYYDFGLKKNVDYTGHRIENVISATVPDSTPLIFKYTYTVYAQTCQSDPDAAGNCATVPLGVTNKVTLEGTDEYSESNNINTAYRDAVANAAFNGARAYTFYKVETGNHGVLLQGAVFSAFEADGGSSIKTYTTGAGGSFSIEWDAKTYKKDTLYYVTETTAPAGHRLPDVPVKYYFYFSDKSDDELAQSGFYIPDGEKAVNLLSAGETVNVENEKVETTSIDVVKTWLSADGSEAINTPDSITFVLYRATQSSTQIIGDNKETVGRYVLTAADAQKLDGDYDIKYTGKWSANLSTLPAKNDAGTAYKYWVEEEAVAGYMPEYSYGTTPIESGTIEITNKPYTYSLPKTGSAAAAPLYASGFALIAAAVGLFDIKINKRSKGNKNKKSKKGMDQNEM